MTIDRRWSVRGDGVDLAVVEHGPAGAPTVVLVHGFPDDHTVWDAVAAVLADRFHVVSYDVRGTGGSGAPPSNDAYMLSRLSADLRMVIEATAGGRPAHVVGHDWGGIQAWELVTDPDAGGASLIASYTTISGPCLDHVGHWLRDGKGRGKQLRMSWYVGAFQIPGLFDHAWERTLPARWPAMMARTEGVEVGPSPGLSRNARSGLKLYRANMLARLAKPRARRAQTRVQIIVPLRDRYVGPDIARTGTLWSDEVRVREIDGGHWVVRRDPPRVAELIAAWVEGRRPRVVTDEGAAA